LHPTPKKESQSRQTHPLTRLFSLPSKHITIVVQVFNPFTMSKQYEDPDLEGLNLSDSDDHLFDSPVAVKTLGKTSNGENRKTEGAEPQNKTRSGESRYEAEETREAQLRQELENIRKINTVIEGVVESLEKAKTNMDVSSTHLSKAMVGGHLLTS
jgi:hypothetical protein